jgi:hypothetical protein
MFGGVEWFVHGSIIALLVIFVTYFGAA